MSKKTKVHCDQCEMIAINGVACHETGCPNSGSRWDRETQDWVLQRECRDFGLTIDANMSVDVDEIMTVETWQDRVLMEDFIPDCDLCNSPATVIVMLHGLPLSPYQAFCATCAPVTT